MKLRRDFVTNSSSSSFIISRNDITRGHLLDLLLEIANKEAKKWDDMPNPCYTWDDVSGNGVGHYNIREYIDVPYSRCDGEEYNNVYVVDNDECGRYDWNIIDDILINNGIHYSYGYCD